MATLADKICAAAGTRLDHTYCGAFSRLAEQIKKAQRFVLDIEAALAVDHVKLSKPSSIRDAIHLSRPPFPITWVEYPFRELRTRNPQGANSLRPGTFPPLTVGCLMHECGFGPGFFAEYAWDLGDMGINVCGLGTLASYATKIPRYIGLQGVDDLDIEKLHDMQKRGALVWKDLSAKEREAVLDLQDHQRLVQAPSMQEFAERVQSRVDAGLVSIDEAGSLAREWAADMLGEPPFFRAALLLMNSKNVAEPQEVDFDRLNRQRVRKGKAPLLSHSVVKLSLSRVQRNRSGAGDGAQASKRAHLVRGHFKLRKGGVFWWSHHVRGSARAGMVHRIGYQVEA